MDVRKMSENATCICKRECGDKEQKRESKVHEKKKDKMYADL